MPEWTSSESPAKTKAVSVPLRGSKLRAACPLAKPLQELPLVGAASGTLCERSPLRRETLLPFSYRRRYANGNGKAEQG